MDIICITVHLYWRYVLTELVRRPNYACEIVIEANIHSPGDITSPGII